MKLHGFEILKVMNVIPSGWHGFPPIPDSGEENFLLDIRIKQLDGIKVSSRRGERNFPSPSVVRESFAVPQRDAYL